MRVDVEWGDVHPNHRHAYHLIAGWRWHRWWWRREVWEECWHCGKVRSLNEQVEYPDHRGTDDGD